MSNEEKLSGLTRSLLLGVSMGAIGLTQVGCEPVADTAAAPPAAAQGGEIAVRSEDERQLCTRALRTQAASDVNMLLDRYPDSRCIAPLLTALPARTLAALSPDAVAALSPAVLASLPANVASALPHGAQPVAGAVRVADDSARY